MSHATHLGDGAYVTNGGDCLIVTANHHEPENATDVVYIDTCYLTSLIHFLLREGMIHPQVVEDIAKEYKS